MTQTPEAHGVTRRLKARVYRIHVIGQPDKVFTVWINEDGSDGWYTSWYEPFNLKPYPAYAAEVFVGDRKDRTVDVVDIYHEDE